jgi:UDP-N-acetylmuramoyl-L-alanyl-D-glutamate--2,6-diaminopimelate ligase
MKLSKLAQGYIVLGDDVEITGLCHDSRRVKQGDIFLALVGKYDGHEFVNQAIHNGAVAIVVQRELNVSVPQVIVSNTRESMAILASRYYDNPSAKLKLIGVTGTNGKTTVSCILANILQSNGDKVASIGTLGVMVNNHRLNDWDYDTSLTTPDPIQLHSIFCRFVQLGVKYVVMEVSAHALYLDKLQGLYFECSIFTNLSRDHLDFFGTLHNYKNTKLRLFDPKMTKHAIVNIDDDTGLEIYRQSNLDIITYGKSRPSDIFGIHLRNTIEGIEYMLNCMDNIVDVRYKMPGIFSMYNTMAAAAAAHILGVPIKKIAIGISSTNKVNGRFDLIKTNKCNIVVDYAHTDDGLANILSTMRQLTHAKVITVFGCGGDRDSTKRPLMGYVASQYADYTIVTSDNPRSEDADKIISQIVNGIKLTNGAKYKCIPNRADAIRHSLDIANKDDIVVIAGKGSENTQEIGGVFYPHNDWVFVHQQLSILSIDLIE